jgi:hypothetical protein
MKDREDEEKRREEGVVVGFERDRTEMTRDERRKK